MEKKYTADKLSAKTASSGITYEGDAVFNGGPDGTFSFNFNNGTTSEFSVNFEGNDFLTVNGGTGVFEAGDIAGFFNGLYLKVDPSNNLLSWKASQDDLVTFGEDSTVSLYGTGTNNASGAELNIFKGQSNEVTGKLKLNYTTQYLDLEYEDPGDTNIFRLYQGYSYTSKPIRIGANAAANELDDYEEGSYNVQFQVNSVNYGSSNWVSGGGTVWTDNSQYIKVGRKVTLFFDLQYKGIPTAISSYTGDLNLTNLPFTMAHGGGGNISFSWYNRNASSNANPQDLGGATRLTPNGTNQATLINLEHIEYSSYWNAWYPGSMGTNYLPTQPTSGNIYMHGQFTYFTDN